MRTHSRIWNTWSYELIDERPNLVVPRKLEEGAGSYHPVSNILDAASTLLDAGGDACRFRAGRRLRRPADHIVSAETTSSLAGRGEDWIENSCRWAVPEPNAGGERAGAR